MTKQNVKISEKLEVGAEYKINGRVYRVANNLAIGQASAQYIKQTVTLVGRRNAVALFERRTNDTAFLLGGSGAHEVFEFARA